VRARWSARKTPGAPWFGPAQVRKPTGPGAPWYGPIQVHKPSSLSLGEKTAPVTGATQATGAPEQATARAETSAPLNLGAS